MRIESNARTQATYKGAAAPRTGGGGLFSLGESASAPAAGAAAPVASTAGIDALLALQGADDALHARRKSVRRGKALLDTLDEMKTDLLLGRVSEGRLNALLAVLSQARERSLPGLDATLDEIELRARVELAKFGHFGGV